MSFWRRKKEILGPEDAPSMPLQFDKRLEEALSSADAGDKILKLETLKADIQAEILQKRSEVENRAKLKGLNLYCGLSFGQGALAFGSLFALGAAAAPFTLLILPGLIAAGFASDKYMKVAKKNLEKEADPLLAVFETMKTITDDQVEKILNEDLEAVAKSSRRAEVFAQFPDLKSRFGDAAARKIADGKHPPPPKPPGLSS